MPRAPITIIAITTMIAFIVWLLISWRYDPIIAQKDAEIIALKAKLHNKGIKNEP